MTCCVWWTSRISKTWSPCNMRKNHVWAGVIHHQLSASGCPIIIYSELIFRIIRLLWFEISNKANCWLKMLMPRKRPMNTLEIVPSLRKRALLDLASSATIYTRCLSSSSLWQIFNLRRLVARQKGDRPQGQKYMNFEGLFESFAENISKLFKIFMESLPENSEDYNQPIKLKVVSQIWLFLALIKQCCHKWYGY